MSTTGKPEVDGGEAPHPATEKDGSDVHEPPAPASRRPRILVVDDRRTSREIVKVALGSLDYDVSEAKGGEEGYAPTVSVHTKRTTGSVGIGVRDNGTGIPDSVKAKIFEPFYTTKPTGSGTGLGLSMSYDIISKGHGGDLKVESKPGEFTQFVITLPQ